MRTYTFNIPEAWAGRRAKDYLRTAQGFSVHLIRQIKRQPDAATLNGEPIRLTDPLTAGAVLRITFETSPQSQMIANTSLHVPVVYEDEDIIVFNKPAGMPVHPSPRHADDTLANFFAAHCAQTGISASFHPINRLDRDTTGLCLAAKNTHAAHLLTGCVEKRYLAIANGRLPDDCGTIDAPIARAPGSVILRTVSPAGQRAVTHFAVLKRLTAGPREKERCLTLVGVQLETGRTHQIRVHFAHIGYPLAGDGLYAGGQILSRHALHCDSLSFTAANGEKIELHIPLPNDMEELLHNFCI